MYPPASMMIKESPKGGVTLCSIYVPEGTPMSVSYSFKFHLYECLASVSSLFQSTVCYVIDVQKSRVLQLS